MDRYRYFIFNQRNMVLLGLLQVAFSTLCVVSGFVDGMFGGESPLGRTRAPVWAGMVTRRSAFYPSRFPLRFPRGGRGRGSSPALPRLPAKNPGGAAGGTSARRSESRFCRAMPRAGPLRPPPPAGRRRDGPRRGAPRAGCSSVPPFLGA